MWILKLSLLAGLVLSAAGLAAAPVADDAKHTIDDVMKLANKDGLAKKVISGKASDEEKKQLYDLFVDLSKNSPPKGPADSWKTKTTALVAASKDVVDGKAGAADALKKANNCGACHKVHKAD